MNQKARILQFLKRGRVLTRLNSWDELGIIEAPARISELRKEGYPIKTTLRSVRNVYGEKVQIANWTLG